jgi:subtilisin family serine protease
MPKVQPLFDAVPNESGEFALPFWWSGAVLLDEVPRAPHDTEGGHGERRADRGAPADGAAPAQGSSDADDATVAAAASGDFNDAVTHSEDAAVAVLTAAVASAVQRIIPVATGASTVAIAAEKPDAASAAPADGVLAALAAPTDPFFGSQWHLTQPVAGLFDLGGLQNVWDKGFTGLGTRVLVIDDGFDYNHTDIAPNYLDDGDFDFDPTTGVNDDFDAFGDSAGANSNNHGTGVIGIIGAARNGTGAVGVSYDTELLGYRTSPLISNFWLENIRDAITFGSDDAVGGADVINISQGMSNLANTAFGGNLNQTRVAEIRAAIDGASDDGRGGLGTIIVKSAGNSRGSAGAGDVDNYDVNADGWTNFTQQIVVASVDQNGTVSSYSSYGAAILVSAIGGPLAPEVVTTDRVGVSGTNNTDFQFFNGTSAAAPMVAGVVALILDANPALGWRDVQDIIAYSARHVGSPIDGITTDAIEREPWEWNGATNWNGGGLHFSNDYGYGLIDARAAVSLAETWLVGNAAHTSANEVFTEQDGFNGSTVIPDGNALGTNFNINEAETLEVERVNLLLRFSTTAIGDLEVYLTSPDGTTSELVRDTLADFVTDADSSANFAMNYWIFESQEFHGEMSNGVWTVRVVDDNSVDVLTVTDIILRTFGNNVSANDRYVFTNEYSNFDGVAGHATFINDTNGGTDTINAAAVTTNVTVNLTTNTGSIDGVAVTFANLENIITGDGNDNLTGKAGANALRGGRGNDTYNLGSEATGVDSVTDIGGAADVITSTITRSLASFGTIDRLTLLGAGAINGTGNNLVNLITGNTGANVLTAVGAQVDTLVGLAGNDTYVIDSTIDVVQEAGASGVADRVNWTGTAGQTYTLAANVEILNLMGAAATHGTGNAVTNTITGNSALNVLTAAGAGNIDILVGLGGSDTYVIDSSIDTVQEAAGGGVADLVNWTGTAGQLYTLTAEVEALTLMGAAATNGTGNASINILTGNSANNTLRGAANNDLLLGRGGTDSLFGDAGNDTFRFLVIGDSAVGGLRDVIRDLDDAGLGNDVIDLSMMPGVTAFISTAAFTAPGQVRVQQAGVNVLVQINTAGNSVAESEILIANATLGAGVGQVDASDFMV